jgi:ribosomal protein L11 methyltransferase
LKTWPALDIQPGAQSDLVLALVDDFKPTALEERGDGLRLFFATSADRDRAASALPPRFHVSPIDVPDDDWARRSQENLTPITVGRITVAPPWHQPPLASTTSELRLRKLRISSHESRATSPEPITIVIVPSMGFGTGHHATTRLCLAALQTIDLTGASVLDVGTGSGVLAIAADRLGAARAAGIDCDEDAIQSARENLALNPATRHVTFDLLDLTASALPQADVVTANLTGALLVRSASRLAGAVRSGGTLILSGALTHEREEVFRAFAGMVLTWEGEEDGWVGIAVKKP